MKNKIKSTKKKLPAIGEEEYIQKLLKLNDNLLMAVFSLASQQIFVLPIGLGRSLASASLVLSPTASPGPAVL